MHVKVIKNKREHAYHFYWYDSKRKEGMENPTSVKKRKLTDKEKIEWCLKHPDHEATRWYIADSLGTEDVAKVIGIISGMKEK